MHEQEPGLWISTSRGSFVIGLQLVSQSRMKPRRPEDKRRSAMASMIEDQLVVLVASGLVYPFIAAKGDTTTGPSQHTCL